MRIILKFYRITPILILLILGAANFNCGGGGGTGTMPPTTSGPGGGSTTTSFMSTTSTGIPPSSTTLPPTTQTLTTQTVTTQTVTTQTTTTVTSQTTQTTITTTTQTITSTTRTSTTRTTTTLTTTSTTNTSQTYTTITTQTTQTSTTTTRTTTTRTTTTITSTTITTTVTTRTTTLTTTTRTTTTVTTVTTRTTTTLTTTVTTRTTTTTRTSTTRTTTVTTATTITTLTTTITTTTICPWCPKLFDDMEAYNSITQWQTAGSGAWTTYAQAGTISLIPAAMTAGIGQGANSSANAMCVTYSGVTPEAQVQGEFKVQSAPYNPPFAAGEVEDLSSYASLTIWLKGDGVNSFELRIPTNPITDYSWYRYTIGVVPNTWTQYTVPLSSFAQAGWGSPQYPYGTVITQVQSLQVVDTNGGNGSICMDEIYFNPSATAPTTGTYTTTTLTCNLSNYLSGTPWLTPVDSNISAMWADYKTRFFVNCGSDGYINWVPDNPNTGVSEGIGYGMLLAAYLNDQTTFDKLWKYHERPANLDAGAYVNGSYASGLMHWHANGCTGGAAAGHYSAATDSEHDVAIGLLYANILRGLNVWSNTGIDYETQAKAVIQKTRQYLIQTDGYVKNGDEWGGPNHPSQKCMNPSYFSPAFYKVFKYYENLWYGAIYNSLWDSAVAKSYDVINNAHTVQGYALVPNWALSTGLQDNCGGAAATPSNEYGYDAVREPIRIATDLAWFNDSNALTEIGRHKTVWDARIGAGDNFGNIQGPYALNGTSIGGDANATFRASAGLVYMFYQGSDPTAYANAGSIIYSSTNTGINSEQIYFNSSVGMYAMLLGSGRFKKPICN